MNSSNIRFASAFVNCTLVLGLLAGCGDKSSADKLAAARASVEKRDDNTALIQLKDLLQTEPGSVDGRLLLGTVLLRRGDANGAVVELRRVVDARPEGSAAVLLLTEALLASGQPKKVLELEATSQLPDSASGAELKVQAAMAQALLGDKEAASRAVKAALVLDPKSASGRLMHARLEGEQGRINEALAVTQAVITEFPRRADALQLKGDLIWRGQLDPEAAKPVFKEVLKLEPAHAAAHSALLNIALQQSDIPGFREALAVLKKVNPGHPEMPVFDVQLAMLDGKLVRAREGVQKLLRVAPGSAVILQLAGSIEYQAGFLRQAEVHLTQALKLVPKLQLASRLLAEIYLRAGQPDRALALLKPVISSPTAGPLEVALAAQAYLQAGDMAKAEALFTQAAKADPKDPRHGVAVALGQIGKGDQEGGFKQLEQLAAAEKTTYADLALISARLQQKELDRALKDVDRLEAKEPGKPLPHLIRGRIALLRRDKAAARVHFEKALAADPVYFPAIEDLASIDLVEKKLAEAQKRYEALLARQPGNPRAMLAVAQLRRAAGESPEKVDAMLVEAVKQNRGELMTHLRLVEFRLSRRQGKAAAEAATDGLSVYPDHPALLDLLGQAHMEVGNVQQAVAAFDKAVKLQPESAAPLIRLANGYFTRQEYSLAAQTFKRALAISPDLVAAHRGLVLVALATKKPDEALSVARALQKQRPNGAAGFLMESELYMNQGKWDAAVLAMRSALQRDNQVQIAKRLHALYLKAGQTAEADRFADAWMRERPKDGEFLFHLAALAMERKDYPKAEALSRQVLAVVPELPVALNNLAWLLVQQGKAGAVAFAEKANTLVPDQPIFLDTLASALAADKQFDKALDAQQKAMKLAGDAPQYRLGLAKLLLAAGDKPKAKAELEKLAGMGAKFGAQAEVAALQKGL